MAVELAPAIQSPSSTWKPKTHSLEEIIAQGRSQPAPFRGGLLLCLATGLLMWAAFPPVDFGFLAWACLAPLGILARLERPTRRMYWSAYLGGLMFWVPALQWMRLGHAYMYGAWAALALYMAVYFPVALWLTRVGVWRVRLPLCVALPIAWTGLELLRGFLMTGFAWYFLGHSQYRFTNLVQIADLGGTYLVSFLVAAFGGCLAELPSEAWLRSCGLVPAHIVSSIASPSRRGMAWRVATCLGLFAAACGYGMIRRSGGDFAPGPRVALIQGDFKCELEHDESTWVEIQRTHERLTGEAVIGKPQLVVWPETMFRWPLVETPPDMTDGELQRAHPNWSIAHLKDPNIAKRLSDLAQMGQTGLMVGLTGIELDQDSAERFNSAVLVQPSGKIEKRYDKLHRVVFGEYLPLAKDLPSIAKLIPYPEGFGIEAGQGFQVYDLAGFRIAPIICFEDTVPHLVRDLVRQAHDPATGRELDVLVNLTNDGWFRGSSEHQQHLVTATFRCIETRTPMVRAVNSGISAIIDGDGVVRERAPHSRNTVVAGVVPLDPRRSLYVATGDWFASLCLVGSVLIAARGVTGNARHPTPTNPVQPA